MIWITWFLSEWRHRHDELMADIIMYDRMTHFLPSLSHLAFIIVIQIFLFMFCSIRLWFYQNNSLIRALRIYKDILVFFVFSRQRQELNIKYVVWNTDLNYACWLGLFGKIKPLFGLGICQSLVLKITLRIQWANLKFSYLNCRKIFRQTAWPIGPFDQVIKSVEPPCILVPSSRSQTGLPWEILCVTWRNR